MTGLQADSSNGDNSNNNRYEINTLMPDLIYSSYKVDCAYQGKSLDFENSRKFVNPVLDNVNSNQNFNNSENARDKSQNLLSQPKNTHSIDENRMLNSTDNCEEVRNNVLCDLENDNSENHLFNPTINKDKNSKLKRSDTYIKDRPSMLINPNNNDRSRHKTVFNPVNGKSRELVNSNTYDADPMISSFEYGGKDMNQGDIMLGSIYEFNLEANQSETDCMFDRNDFVESDFIIDDSDDDVNFCDDVSSGFVKGEDRNLNAGGCSNNDVSECVENSLYSYGGSVKIDSENNNMHDGYDNLQNLGGKRSEDGPYANITSNISQNIPLSKVKSLINELDTESDLLLSEEIYETIYYYNKNKSSSNECLKEEEEEDEEEDEILIVEQEVEEGEDEYRIGGGEERSSTYVELMNSTQEETDNMSVAESLVCDDEVVLEQECGGRVKQREMLALPIGHDVIVQSDQSRMAGKVDVERLDLARKLHGEGLDHSQLVYLARKLEGEGLEGNKHDIERLDGSKLEVLARNLDVDGLDYRELVYLARKLDIERLDLDVEGLDSSKLDDITRKLDVEGLDHRKLVYLAGKLDLEELDGSKLHDLARKLEVKRLDGIRLVDLVDVEGLDGSRLVETLDEGRLLDLARQINVVGDDLPHVSHDVALPVPSLFVIDRTETVEEVPCVRNVVTVEKICFREQKRRSSLETDEDLLGKSYSDSILNRNDAQNSKGFRFMWWKKDGGKDKLTRSSKSVNEARPMKTVHNNSVASSKDSVYGSTDLAVFENDLEPSKNGRQRRYDKQKKNHGLSPCCVG
ncbi:putative uncharacterized protein DDB_G0282133 isoform X2 [Nilaparvata lugens]|uniref:putative uncharacterized protein DDB_G0282133 isoform X2 n=1 Tax=Nilaparvata lugens TaxID=108931 RepID=UPI00193DD05C|nr:putative uncharacterized protein DDB_G0282133 isoform X2 [Nilaparvata lugens]